jgi:predicted anti-sigma-YlaC factor YlaD
MISCKKATELITIREDRGLSQSERFQLQLHLGVCSLCRKYLQQTAMIIRSVKQLVGSEKTRMSEEKKNELRQMLNKKQP